MARKRKNLLKNIGAGFFKMAFRLSPISIGEFLEYRLEGHPDLAREVQQIALNSLGIGWNENSGEHFFIEQILPEILHQHQGKEKPLLMDVGANIGYFTYLLGRQFGNAQIISFEPNPFAFEKLKIEVEGKNVKAENLALNDYNGSAILYIDPNDKITELGSLSPLAYEKHFDVESLVRVEVETTTLDIYCAANQITYIDYLKIDAEGFEYPILKGAEILVKENRIHCIQFEFNTMNVALRHFIADFYNILPGYDFYRIVKKGLVPMGNYQPLHEQFQFQNIVAINHSIHNKGNLKII